MFVYNVPYLCFISSFSKHFWFLRRKITENIGTTTRRTNLRRLEKPLMISRPSESYSRIINHAGRYVYKADLNTLDHIILFFNLSTIGLFLQYLLRIKITISDNEIPIIAKNIVP